MIPINLNALNPFRRQSAPAASEAAAKKPTVEASKATPQGMLDFFKDTWKSTVKVVDKAVDAGKELVDEAVDAGKDLVKTGLKKGRETVEETLWGEYKEDWGDYGDRFDDPEDANAQRQSTSTIERRIAARAEAEGVALGKLSTADQARYQKLQTVIASDPMAKEALQGMLIDGRLPGAKALGSSSTLLEGLASLCDQTLAAGLTRESLVSDLVQELENPVIITQGDMNTCVATSSVMDLAMRNPAEYVRLVAGLASSTGKVKLAGGSTVKREAEWQQTLGDRTQSIHLLSGSLMELGNGFLTYDPVKDKQSVFDWGLYEGLFIFGANRVLSQLHDRNYDGVLVTRWNLSDVMKRMDAATDAGRRVPVGLAWGDGGHQVVVEKVADGQVEFLNPHGNRERLPMAEFEARLRSAHFYK